jgi:hypothetical protein
MAVENSKIKQAVCRTAQALENFGIQKTCKKTKLLEEEEK